MEAANSSNGHITYSPFEIPFNAEPLRKPRRLRVVCVGAGFAGLTLAYKINIEKKLGEIVDFQIYERNVCIAALPIQYSWPSKS